MPRIVGVDIPKEKRVEIALTYIFGIGRSASNAILTEAGVNPDKRAKDLDDNDLTAITRIIQEKYRVEGDLRREYLSNIKRLMSIGTYRGLRHKKNLPVRGQRTRTNARTRKGPKKTVGVMKEKAVRKAAAPKEGE